MTGNAYEKTYMTCTRVQIGVEYKCLRHKQRVVPEAHRQAAGEVPHCQHPRVTIGAVPQELLVAVIRATAVYPRYNLLAKCIRPVADARCAQQPPAAGDEDHTPDTDQRLQEAYGVLGHAASRRSEKGASSTKLEDRKRRYNTVGPNRVENCSKHT
ncbi:hypothetical protein PR048_000282 [Dryococelus australis]|uniref:Uncharacterized protein n=1 Tax=Dryococelus australis TaxID=614101 RepID=A0ABQ9IE94_9NEOP|nr:hypothetical protein PR048_000282 [Dryococelus australis]